MILVLASLFWFFRLIKVAYHAVQYWDIKKFYNTALKIADVSGNIFINVPTLYMFLVSLVRTGQSHLA